MPGVYKRFNKKTGKYSTKYYCWWAGVDGKTTGCAGLADKAASLKIANARDAECRMIREGIVDPGERARREASFRAVADHVEDYRLELLARGGTAKHATEAAGVLTRLLADASVTSVADLSPDQLQQALGRLAQRRSARTVNKALGFVKAFALWLEHSNRIKEVPRGLKRIDPRNQEADRRRLRRALTLEEFERLIVATREAPDVVTRRVPRKQGTRTTAVMTGLERAMAYRVAAGTGFRANEIRSLTPESFELADEDPAIVVEAAYSKRRRRDRQPIRRALAAELRPFVAVRAPGECVFPLPHRTAAMLADDMKRAGIDYEVGGKVADFHSLRAAYITGLVRSGMGADQAQKLARHSDVKLTLQTYTSTTQKDLRKALEGE